MRVSRGAGGLVEDDGHGTHVAGTIGAALNGLGMAGVAPDVDIVNLRAGQDSGFFLLRPTVDALTYAGNHGIDVVNMSFFIDPWLSTERAIRPTVRRSSRSSARSSRPPSAHSTSRARGASR